MLPRQKDDPPAGSVDLWLCANWRSVPAELVAALTVDELVRYGRYRAPDARDDFVVRRSMARRILGSYLGVEPRSLRFDRTCARCGDDRHGKPRIAFPHGSPVMFNVSSSRGVVVIAVGHGVEVGVDTEREVSDVSDLVPAVCSPSEREWLEACEAGSFARHFTSLWVRKEAALKFLGVGLSVPLKHVACVPPSGRGLAVVRVVGAREVSVGNVTAIKGWSLAIALAEPPPRVRIVSRTEDRELTWEVASYGVASAL